MEHVTFLNGKFTIPQFLAVEATFRSVQQDDGLFLVC